MRADGVALLSVLSACGYLGTVAEREWVHMFVVRLRVIPEGTTDECDHWHVHEMQVYREGSGGV